MRRNAAIPTVMNATQHLLLTLLATVLAVTGCDAQSSETETETETAPMPQPTQYSKSGYDLTPLTKAQIAKALESLTPEQVRVTQHAGTEPAFCGNLVDNELDGIYACVVCGLPLFRSTTKFHSGTGWPSFYAPFDPDHVAERADGSHGMVRTEIVCRRSGSHLGHVFDDGPAPTRRRYCLNSAALTFFPAGAPLPPQSRPADVQAAYFAGGCFWGVEDVFAQLEGVIDAESGYQNGSTANPSYEQVCSGTTGHAEAVKVTFDAGRISYRELLRIFFANHNPTTRNRQGPDVGTQYRSAVFAATPEQKAQAEAYLKELRADPRFAGRDIVTAVEDAKTFYPAEAYHQDYHRKHGGSCRVVR